MESNNQYNNNTYQNDENTNPIAFGSPAQEQNSAVTTQKADEQAASDSSQPKSESASAAASSEASQIPSQPIKTSSQMPRAEQGQFGPANNGETPRAFGQPGTIYAQSRPVYGQQSQPYAPQNQPYTPQDQSYNHQNQVYGQAGTPYNQPGQPYSQQGQAYNPNSQAYSQPGQPYTQSAPQTPPYYGYQTYAQTAAAPRKKAPKRGASKGFVVAMVIVAVLLSALAGYGAAKLALAANPVSKGGGNVTINYTTSTVDNSNAITGYGDAAYVNSLVADSVVEVTTETVTTNSYFGQYVTEGAGSGVIIDTTGYIITCSHVVEGATSVSVRLANGQKYEAEIIGTDSQTDIAVIKIDASDLTAAIIGDSNALIVGQPVFAIGNPLGELGGSLTNGIISALDREIEIDGQMYNLMQTNAAINPGNSGGGLFDANGNLIGIVNAKSSGDNIEGLGFAIPISDAIDVTKELITHGYITGRVKLGFQLIEIQDNSDYQYWWQYREYITDYGVYIITSESPDFKLGDRIIAMDGIQVSSLSEIKSMLGDYSVGDTVTITISRLNAAGRSQILNIDLKLSEKTAEDN